MSAYSFILKQKKFEIKQVLSKKYIGPIVGLISKLLILLNFKKIGLKMSLWAHRVSYTTYALSTIKHFVSDDYEYKNVLLSLVENRSNMNEVSKRMLIIRWPIITDNKILSKGVLILTFTHTFAYFLKNIKLSELEKYFHIVLEPSWAGYADPDILTWSTLKNPVFIQATELLDRNTINALNGSLVPVSIGTSNWVDYNLFKPCGDEKIFDSIYVANTTLIKRIPKFLSSVSNIVNKYNYSYKCALVCSKFGGRSNDVMNLIDYYKLNKICNIYFDLSYVDVNDIINKSKVNVLLSKKEGSNKSLFESLFCNVPALALADNIGLNKCYINEYTGMLVWDNYLESALLHMKNAWHKYNPRDWAINNISPEISTKQLFKTIANYSNDRILIEDFFKNKGFFVKVKSPEIQYMYYKSFDKVMFNSKFLELFLYANDVNDIVSKLIQLQNQFEHEISFDVA
jgi:hypothetical protein